MDPDCTSALPEHLIRDAEAMSQQGLSPRQIAARLKVLPSQVQQLANARSWPKPAAPNWYLVREQFENGQSLPDLATSHAIALSTLRKRKSRENWQPNSISGIGSLRVAVAALERALQAGSADDPLLTARIGGALSMAAGRLSRAERGSGLAPDEPGLDALADETDPEAALVQSKLLELIEFAKANQKDKTA